MITLFSFVEFVAFFKINYFFPQRIIKDYTDGHKFTVESATFKYHTRWIENFSEIDFTHVEQVSTYVFVVYFLVVVNYV